MTDLPTREALADTEARHAHRDLLAEKDAEIERLTALLQSSSEMLHEAAVEFDAIHPGAGIAEAIRYQISRIKEPRDGLR